MNVPHPSPRGRLALRIYLAILGTFVLIVTGFLLSRTAGRSALLGRRAAFMTMRLAPYLESPAALHAELERMRDRGSEVTVYARDGRLLGSSNDDPTAALDPSEVPRLPPEGKRVGSTTLAFPVGPEGAYAIFRPHRAGREGPDPTFEIATVLVALALASLLLARMIARPLEKIAEATRAFGRGALGARTGLTRRDELGELSRTPLSRIRVALDLASEGDAQAARASLGEIAADLAELEDLVDDVLAMARLDAQAAEPRPIPPLHTQRMPAGVVVEKALVRFRAAHPERRIDVSLTGEEAPSLEIDADPNLLCRVVQNLLENAHKYSAPTSLVQVSLTSRDGHAVVTVRDRGHGIAPEDLPRVFEPFFRADRSRTRGTGGAGLGLALAKRVVEAHGGRIDIDSEVDRGTTVTFAIPLAASEARMHPSAAS